MLEQQGLHSDLYLHGCLRLPLRRHLRLRWECWQVFASARAALLQFRQGVSGGRGMRRRRMQTARQRRMLEGRGVRPERNL